MKIAKVKITGITTLAQGKYINVEKLPKELPKDYEIRTWRERLHYDQNGVVFIPNFALKNCLSEAAKFLSIKIPGKSQATYTKHFEAGVMVMECMSLGIKKDAVDGQWLFVPSDGKRGGGKRVEKCFPVMPQWEGNAEFLILDETITEDVFTTHIQQAGQFIGLGSLRPRNNGFFGRFDAQVLSFE